MHDCMLKVFKSYQEFKLKIKCKNTYHQRNKDDCVIFDDGLIVQNWNSESLSSDAALSVTFLFCLVG